MEISAKEIERQANRLKEEATEFLKNSGYIDEKLRKIRDIVHSEDSNLADTLNNLSVKYTEVYNDVHLNFFRLSEIMNDYANKTINNEINTVEDLSEIDEILSGIEDVI